MSNLLGPRHYVRKNSTLLPMQERQSPRETHWENSFR